MITYRITSKKTPAKPARISRESTEAAKLEKILRKASLKAFKVFPVGSTVKFKGTNREGTVIAIRTTMEDVSFKGEKPFFINIRFHDDLPEQCFSLP